MRTAASRALPSADPLSQFGSPGVGSVAGSRFAVAAGAASCWAGAATAGRGVIGLQAIKVEQPAKITKSTVDAFFMGGIVRTGGTLTV
ncbi:MAG: hypothetical protein RI986_483 [Planctomycetota bacterium]